MTEYESSSSLAHFPDDHSSWVWARLKLGSSSPMQMLGVQVLLLLFQTHYQEMEIRNRTTRIQSGILQYGFLLEIVA